jgi:hypothetical protein
VSRAEERRGPRFSLLCHDAPYTPRPSPRSDSRAEEWKRGDGGGHRCGELTRRGEGHLRYDTAGEAAAARPLCPAVLLLLLMVGGTNAHVTASRIKNWKRSHSAAGLGAGARDQLRLETNAEASISSVSASAAASAALRRRQLGQSGNTIAYEKLLHSSLIWASACSYMQKTFLGPVVSQSS